jgi:hypothetical protein
MGSAVRIATPAVDRTMRPIKKRKPNRVAWGLAVVLAVVLVDGGGTFVSYQNRLPEKDRWITLLPKGAWGFRPDESVANINAIVRELGGDAGDRWPTRYRLGFVSVRVE